MWLLYIFMSVLTAAVVLVLVRPLPEEKLSRFLTAAVPCAALILFLMLGRPDLPGQPAAQSGEDEARYVMLARRPAEMLAADPENSGALAVLAEISDRMGKSAEAAQLYARAVRVAEKTGDARLSLYREKLAVALKKKAAR